jgi:Ca2+-binding EF-hand superfamily protein
MKPFIPLASAAVLFGLAACSGSPVTTTSSQFSRADMNKDGSLNIAEYHALFDIQAQDGYPLAKNIVEGDPHDAERTIQQRFDYLDTDKNGKLSREELAVSAK